MGAHLEIWDPEEVRLVPLPGSASVGTRETNDVPLDDPGVSGLHCVLTRYAGGWTVRDLESANGTFVNGQRVWGERPLRSGDEITLGASRLRFCTDEPAPPERVQRVDPLPYLTRRERDVLVALCRPLARGGAFTGPASVLQIATELHVSEAAVRQHLVRLAQKLEVKGDGEQRRAAIANEAVRRGIVQIADLRYRYGSE